MKILLLTDVPPSKSTTGGLFLDQLCRLLPKGSVACFAVLSPSLDLQVSPDLTWMPVECHKKPRENAISALPRQVRALPTLAIEGYNSLVKTQWIARRAIEFGRKFGADAVWCLLEGQTMIRLALPVSRGLGVPLLTQVMDPPGWWLRAYGLDRLSTARALREFDRAMRGSVSCAAGSWAMAKQYEDTYSTRTVAVLPSLDARLAVSSAKRVHAGKDFVIGMAGQIYATEEWHALIEGLNKMRWKLGSRDIKIQLLGKEMRLRADTSMRVEFLGWHAQEDVVKLLSKTDVLYCPYWFDPLYETEARLSFPGKLTTYLATGRPVLFHGPSYASPGRFLRENDAATFCHSLEHSEIIATLTRLASDEDYYFRIATNGRTAFESHLTFTSLRRSFAEFLQVEEDWLSSVGELR